MIQCRVTYEDFDPHQGLRSPPHHFDLLLTPCWSFWVGAQCQTTCNLPHGEETSCQGTIQQWNWIRFRSLPAKKQLGSLRSPEPSPFLGTVAFGLCVEMASSWLLAPARRLLGPPSAVSPWSQAVRRTDGWHGHRERSLCLQAPLHLQTMLKLPLQPLQLLNALWTTACIIALGHGPVATPSVVLEVYSTPHAIRVECNCTTHSAHSFPGLCPSIELKNSGGLSQSTCAAASDKLQEPQSD